MDQFQVKYQNGAQTTALKQNNIYKPQITMNKGGGIAQPKITGDNVVNRFVNQSRNKTLNEEIMPVLKQVLTQIDQRNGHIKNNTQIAMNSQQNNLAYQTDESIPRTTSILDQKEGYSIVGDNYYISNNNKVPSLSFIDPKTGQIIDIQQQLQLGNHRSGFVLPHNATDKKYQNSSSPPLHVQPVQGKNNLQSFYKQANAMRNISPLTDYKIDSRQQPQHFNSLNFNQPQQTAYCGSPINEFDSRESSLNDVSNPEGIVFNQTIGSRQTNNLPPKIQKKFNQLRIYPLQKPSLIEEVLQKNSPVNNTPNLHQQQYSPTQYQDNINMQTMNGSLIPQNNSSFQKNYPVMKAQGSGNEILHSQTTNKALMELKEQRKAMKQLINTTSQKIMFGPNQSNQQIQHIPSNPYSNQYYIADGAKGINIEPQRFPIMKDRQKSNDQLWSTNQNLPQLKHGLVDSSPQSQENKRYSIQPQTMKYNTTKEFEPMFSSGNESRNGAANKNSHFNNYSNNRNMPLTQSSKGSELPLLKHFIQKTQYNGSELSSQTVQPFYEFVEENAKKKQQLKPQIKIIPSNQNSIVDQQRPIAAVLSHSSLKSTPMQPHGFRTQSQVEQTHHQDIPQPSESVQFTSKDLQAEKVELLYKILDVLVQQDPSLVDQLISNDSISKTAHQIHLKNKSNLNIQESPQQQMMNRQLSVDQASQLSQYPSLYSQVSMQPMSHHLLIPISDQSLQPRNQYNQQQLAGGRLIDYNSKPMIIKRNNNLQPIEYQQMGTNALMIAASLNGSLKDKGLKKSKVPIKFKVKKQFAEQLFVDDTQSTLNGDDSEYEIPKQQVIKQQSRLAVTQQPYIKEDSVVYQEDNDQLSVDVSRNPMTSSQVQQVQSNFKYTTPPENETTKIQTRASNAQSSLYNGNGGPQLRVAPPQYSSKPSTMENELKNRRAALNGILKAKPPLTIDVELANGAERPLMKDEAIQFEDIYEGGIQNRISNNKLHLPTQNHQQSNFNQSNNSYSGILRDSNIYQRDNNNVHMKNDKEGSKFQEKIEVESRNINQYVSPTAYINQLQSSKEIYIKESRTYDHQNKNNSSLGRTILEENQIQQMSPMGPAQDILTSSAHKVSGKPQKVSQNYNPSIRRSEIQEQSPYPSQDGEKTSLVSSSQQKEIRGRTNKKQSSSSIQEFHSSRTPISQQKSPEIQKMHMSSQVRSLLLQVLQIRKFQEDEEIKQQENLQIQNEKSLHQQPRKKDSQVIVTKLDDNELVSREETKIPYTKSKFVNQQQSRPSNVSSVDTKRGGILTQKTYEDSVSDKVDVISSIQGPRSKASENSLKHFILSGGRNEADNKRRHSTVLDEVAEEHSEKTQHAKIGNKKPTNHESSTKHGIEQSLRTHDTQNLEKKKPHKFIVLKDYNPADEEILTKGPMLPKSSSSAVIGNGTPGHVGPINYSNRKSSNKLLFTQNILHKLKKKESTIQTIIPAGASILEHDSDRRQLLATQVSSFNKEETKQEKSINRNSLASSLEETFTNTAELAVKKDSARILKQASHTEKRSAAQEFARSLSQRKKNSNKPPKQQPDQPIDNVEELMDQDQLKQRAELLPPPPSGKRRFVDIQLKLSVRNKSPNQSSRRASINLKK